MWLDGYDGLQVLIMKAQMATNNRGVQVMSVVEHRVNETRQCLEFCCRDITAHCEGLGSLQGRATFRDKIRLVRVLRFGRTRI